MIDIIQKLENAVGAPPDVARQFMLEAAGEIKRLRGAIREVTYHAEGCCGTDVSDMQRELTRKSIERVRAIAAISEPEG